MLPMVDLPLGEAHSRPTAAYGSVRQVGCQRRVRTEMGSSITSPSVSIVNASCKALEKDILLAVGRLVLDKVQKAVPMRDNPGLDGP